MGIKVCIVGAGVCGLTCVKTCIEAGFEVTCYEKSPHFGGLWHYNNDKSQNDGKGDKFYPSVMRTTILNTSKEMSAFSDFPPPANLPNFMKHSLYMDYIRSYVDHFNVLPHLKLNHEILACSPEYDQTTGEICWLVEVKNLQTQSSSQVEKFDKLIVATGHHNSPFVPNFPGQDKFKGQIIHSAYVKDILTDERFIDKNVLVVGIGNSACDAANDLALVANRCYVSCHRGSWFLSRLTPDGLYDFNMRNRWVHWLSNNIPTKLSDLQVIRLAERLTNHQFLGLKPKHKPSEQVPAVNDLFPYRIFTGGVTLKSSIASFTENGVIFDGEDEQEYQFDAVIMATGYLARMPFLSGIQSCLKPSGQSDEYELYLNIFAPKLSIPGILPDSQESMKAIKSLAFIGLVQPSGSIAVIAELQSRYVSMIFSGERQLASTKQMLKHIQRYRAQRSKSIRSHSKDQLVGDWIGYQDEIAKLIGVMPNLKSLFVKDFGLWKRLMFGPSVSYQYRLTGCGRWENARNAVMTVESRVYQGLNDGKNHILYKTRSKSLREKQTNKSTRSLGLGTENFSPVASPSATNGTCASTAGVYDSTN